MERMNSEQRIIRSSPPFVSQETSVVDKDSNCSECIDGGLNDSSTIRDGGRIHNSLSTSYEIKIQRETPKMQTCTMAKPLTISSTTFCAAVALKSFTTTLAPRDANNSE
jgi:hypothetical protein